MKDLKKAKNVYESIKIPEELNSTVNETINRKYVGKK